MPNYCENVLEVIGDDEQRAIFERAHRTEETALSFERSVPTPPLMLDEALAEAFDTKLGMSGSPLPDWYAWRCNAWGTKWDACDPRRLSDDDAQRYNGVFIPAALRYYFTTAWAPPEMWLSTVSRMFPKLRFVLRFVEEGMGFAGYFVAQDGLIDDVEVEIPERKDSDGDWIPFFAGEIVVPADAYEMAGASA